MNRKPKPHVRRLLVKPLERFYRETLDGMKPFDRYVYFMSPFDGIDCLGFLIKGEPRVRDAAKN